MLLLKFRGFYCVRKCSDLMHLKNYQKLCSHVNMEQNLKLNASNPVILDLDQVTGKAAGTEKAT